jgi:DNA-binding response OmpR family regulator
MVLELHECFSTLTDYVKGLRSVGIEAHAVTLGCFEANRDRLEHLHVVLIVPRPDQDTPSLQLIATLSRFVSVPVIAVLNAGQYARPHEWLSRGAHVLVQSTAARFLLACHVHALMRITQGVTQRPDTDFPLTRTERRILELISSKPGQPFSRSAILRHIYDDHRVVCPRTVDAHVKNLRRKLADRAAVRAVYGEGYSFEPLR